MNLKKYSDMRAIGHLLKHYARGVESGNYSNKNIKLDKIKNDYNLAPKRENDSEYLRMMINDISHDKTVRKDAVRMCSWVVDLPRELADKSEAEKRQFFETCYHFLTDRYGAKSGLGEDVVISSYVHKSETTQHMHFAFVPAIKKQGEIKLCAKELINRQELKNCQVELAQELERQGICEYKHILNGATQRDERGRVKSVRQLKAEQSRERNADRWSRTEQNRERSMGRWD